jgi:hypothetical protein
VAEELNHQLVQLTVIDPLPQHSYRVLGVHHIDVCLKFLLYWHRRGDSEVNDGKDEKDSGDYVVSTHFCLVLMGLLVEHPMRALDLFSCQNKKPRINE